MNDQHEMKKDVLEFQPGPKGNKNAKTCRMIGDSSPSTSDSFKALNFRTAAPDSQLAIGRSNMRLTTKVYNMPETLTLLKVCFLLNA